VNHPAPDAKAVKENRWSQNYFDGHGNDAADGLAESFGEIVTVAAAAFLARN
jgi:hypothetical protein